MGKFWPALERLTGQAAVAAEWRALLGPEFDVATRFLRPSGRLATMLPHPGPGGPDPLFVVVEHAPGDFVRVCPQTAEAVPVPRLDLVVFELNREHLVERIARAFGLGRVSHVPNGPTGVTRVGDYTPRAGERVGVFLALPLEPEDLHAAVIELAAGWESPFVLLAPTRQWLAPRTESAVLAGGSFFLTLTETLAVGEAGLLEAVEPLGVVLARLRKRLPGRAKDAGDLSPGNELRRTGGGWRLRFAGRSEPLRDFVGLTYLARLLAEQGKEIHVKDLLGAASGRPLGRLDSGDELVDAEGVTSYRARYEDLRLRREEAERNNDPVALERARGEMAALAEQVSAGKGLGRRTRKLGDEANKARKNVCNAITRAIGQIEKVIPECGRHLEGAVHLGIRCRYQPEQGIDWQV